MTVTDTASMSRTNPGSRPIRPTTGRVLRAVAGLVAAIALFFGAGIAYIIGAVVATGCFIGCNDPDPIAGIPILMAAVVLLALALAALWWALFNRHWSRVWRALGIFGAVLTVVLVALVSSAW